MGYTIYVRRSPLRVAMPSTVTLISPAEFDAMSNNDGFELVSRELVERPISSAMSGFVAFKIGRKLDEYLDTHPIGWALGDGVGYLVVVDGVECIRKPDASIVFKTRLPNGRIPNTSFPFPPDLAVEVLSPSDVYEDVDEKIREYLAAGTQQVWLVRPIARKISVFKSDGKEVVFGPDDVLKDEALLPEFQMRVADLFPQ